MAEEETFGMVTESGEQGMFFGGGKRALPPGAPGSTPGAPGGAPVPTGKLVGGPTGVPTGAAPGGPSGPPRGGPPSGTPPSGPPSGPPPTSRTPGAPAASNPGSAPGGMPPAASFAQPIAGGAPVARLPAQQAPAAPAPSYSYGNLAQSEEQVLLGYFNAVDTDRSGAIDSEELTQSLSKQGYAFKTETAALMIRMFDRTGTGTITWADFKNLHLFIISCQSAFGSCDRDRSGSITTDELPEALSAAGFTVSEDVRRVVAMRLAHGMYAGSGMLIFPAFMDLCAYLGLVRNVHGWWDTDRDGYLTLTVDQMMQVAMILKP